MYSPFNGAASNPEEKKRAEETPSDFNSGTSSFSPYGQNHGGTYVQMPGSAQYFSQHTTVDDSINIAAAAIPLVKQALAKEFNEVALEDFLSLLENRDQKNNTVLLYLANNKQTALLNSILQFVQVKLAGHADRAIYERVLALLRATNSREQSLEIFVSNQLAYWQLLSVIHKGYLRFSIDTLAADDNGRASVVLDWSGQGDREEEEVEEEEDQFERKHQHENEAVSAAKSPLFADALQNIELSLVQCIECSNAETTIAAVKNDLLGCASLLGNLQQHPKLRAALMQTIDNVLANLLKKFNNNTLQHHAQYIDLLRVLLEQGFPTTKVVEQLRSVVARIPADSVTIRGVQEVLLSFSSSLLLTAETERPTVAATILQTLQAQEYFLIDACLQTNHPQTVSMLFGLIAALAPLVNSTHLQEIFSSNREAFKDVVHAWGNKKYRDDMNAISEVDSYDAASSAILFQLLFHNALPTFLIEILAKQGDRKEALANYINTQPNAVELFGVCLDGDKNNPWYQFFHTKRELLATSEKRGLLKDLRAEYISLQASAHQQEEKVRGQQASTSSFSAVASSAAAGDDVERKVLESNASEPAYAPRSTFSTAPSSAKTGKWAALLSMFGFGKKKEPPNPFQQMSVAMKEDDNAATKGKSSRLSYGGNDAL